MTIGMVVKFCIVTGKPADKSIFYKTLKRFNSELADRMTIEVTIPP